MKGKHMKAISTSRLRDNLLKALAVTAVAAVPGAAFAPAAFAAPSTEPDSSLPSGCELDISGGVGTYTDPFLIGNERQLAELEDCGTDDSYYYYELTADIRLVSDDSKSWNDDEYGWDPIGSSGNEFTGYVNGNGHTISGLSMDQWAWGDEQGLFGYTDVATIKNLTVEGNINSNGYDSVGGLIGYSDYTTVSNVHTDVTITNDGSDSDDVGGIVGYAENTSVAKSSSEGNISDYSGSDIGGIIGYGDYFSVYDSTSSSAVGNVDNESDGNDGVGGLVGYGDYGTISNSTFSGSATGYYYVGGAIGYADYVSIDGVNVTSDALVQFESENDSYEIGGISGVHYYGGISDSTFSGELDADQNVGSYAREVGGIAGYLYEGNASNVHVTSDAVITVSGDNEDNSYYIGGIVGELEYSLVADSTNKADLDVNDAEYVGGIVGYAYDGSGVTGSVNTGDVSVRGDNTTDGWFEYVGGVVGYMEDGGIIANSANKGDVVAAGDDYSQYVGGVVGYIDDGSQVTDSYNLGYVEAYDYAAGISGYSVDDTDISFSYNAGDVTTRTGDGDQDGIANGDWADSGNSNVVLDTENSIATDTNVNQLLTPEVKDASVLAGLGWSIGESKSIWAVDSEFNDGYPYLAYEFQAASAGVEDVVFAPVNFANRKVSALSSNAAAYLTLVAAQINDGNYAKVEIDGFTNRRTKSAVARARTAAVKQFLRDAGVESAIVVHNNLAGAGHRNGTVVVTALG